ncbi:MAG: TonB-dependent receptor, partial [Myxococcota bacterium]
DVTARNLSEFPEFGEADQISTELQFNGRFGESVDFVAGFYYFREEGSNNSGLFTFFPFSTATENDFFTLEQTTNSFAGYANTSVMVFDGFKLGGGLRYSRDDKEGTANFPSFGGTPKTNEADFDAITFDVNASYLLARNMTVYAQVQRGYQTGGFPPRPFGGPDQFNIFDEITALNYEVGFKGIINSHIRLAASLYWTEYDDLAVPFSQPNETGFVTIVENAASSRARGFELEANLMYGGFFLNPSVGFIDAEFTSVEEMTQGIEVGAAPPLTPQWTVGANGGYLHNFDNIGSLRAQVNYSFRDDQFGQAVESETELMDARSLLGFNVEFVNADGDWELELYGENILNEVYDQGRLNNPFHGFVGVVLSNDRSEFGLRFTKRCGI